ncbi:hypothetical protein [Phaffia rhodozyma]|uniref:Uncharacterized protein n=1 Tax=Phaffia rhodozyma TaxID=264483 RepID=A0A0F7SH00_PHARH|nr:hypothetical protein [Phaffia rhodozyma]
MPLRRTKTVYTSLDSTLSCPSSPESGRFPLPVSVKNWAQINSSCSNSPFVPSSSANPNRGPSDPCSSFPHSRLQTEHTDRHTYTCPQFSLELASHSILRPTEDGSIYFSPKHPQLYSRSRPYPRGSGSDGAEEYFPAFSRGVTA